ncbi:MAG: hypothetical protein U1C46_02475 [Bacteroidales bacterium]|nr:hypothetical protein [Bacteroidales bacterium]MDZ4203662.1 hypothetical protein [Bacteroidales bacterium]
MKITFFKTQKPKTFSYRPLYYNQRKEELEKIRQAVQGESESPSAERMRVQLHRSWHTRRERSQRNKVTTRKLLIYLAALVLLIYFLFFAKLF